jgi:hypothetical protein
MKSSLTRLTLGVAATTLVSVGASAERPANLANTVWTLQANLEAEQLVITTQGGPGAPGATNCRTIRGEVRGIAPVNGLYCPASGRIILVHKNVTTDVPVRLFSGYVSDQVTGQLLHMAGTMTVLNPAFGDLGEYNFSATR